MSREQLMIDTSLPFAEDPNTEKLKKLELEIRQAKRDLDDARIEARRAREDSDRALSMLRKQLSPLYRALQAVFGELDAAGVPESNDASYAAPAQGADRSSPVWEAWKSKLAPACGKVIDALLIHKELNAKQIMVAAQMGRPTMYDTISKLNKAGLLDKNGGRFSLKKL